jgi:hypothetical protein
LTPLLWGQSGVRKIRQILLEYLSQLFRKSSRRRRHQGGQRKKGNDISRKQYVLPRDRTIKQLSALVETASLNPVAGGSPKMIALFSELLAGEGF